MMIKRLGGVLALGLLALQSVAGHGAAPPREIDVRVLLDDDGLLGYGGCGPSDEAGTPCSPEPEGLDVLALDVREAWLGDAPAIAFRMIVQSAGVHDGRGLRLTLSANGTEHTFVVASPDGAAYTSNDFDLLAGPFDVFDGHPKAIDGWLRLATLGVGVGSELTGMTLASTHHDELDDIMPGGYYVNGAEAPHVPHEPDPGEALAQHGPGTYAIKGPAPLLTLAVTPILLDLNRSGNLTLKVSNPLASTAQTVTLGVLGVGPARFASGSANTTVTLEAGATREVTLSWPAGSLGGNVTILATTDLAGRALQSIQVVAAPVATASPSATSKAGKETPAPAFVPLTLALAALAARRR